MSATTHTPTMVLGRPVQCNDVGSSPTGLVTVEEYGPPGSPIRQTKFTFNSATFTLTRTSGTIASGGLQFYDLPKGNINILNAVAKLAFSIAGAGSYSNLVSSIGSVAADTSNGTLTSTEADVIASTATASTSGAATFNGRLSSAPVLNGTSTASDLFLNMATSDDVTSSRVVTVTGWVIVTWINGGDFSIA